ncbi:MAG: NAD-dependent succinate-semialdehyde dehydrogenase [Ignavibacteriaceae bacterium]
MMISVNPSNRKIIREYSEYSDEKVAEIIQWAETGFEKWRETTFEKRSRLMKNAAEVLRKRRDELAKLMTLEMGKPILQSFAEVEKCAWVCDYYSENAEKFLEDEIVKTDASRSFITFQPLGVILAIMPWNFPFWQVFRFAAPGLMAGNTGILKHSSNVSGCALAIENVFTDAGFPRGIFTTVLVNSKKVERIIYNKTIKGVTLTGSTPAGISVATVAVKVLKKVVLELGGSDPYIILEDADLESAAETCAVARLLNGGQSCIAAKRFIVVEAVYDEFLKLFCDRMKSRKMGDPMDEENDIGPQAREDLRDELHQQVMLSKELGAEIILGGEIPEREGAFYPPTILTNVTKGMPAYHEELFGPVASVIKVKDEAEAIRTANDTVFGLGAAVFTKEAKRGEDIAKNKLEAGSCFVNAFVKSDPRLPFGGIKESGFGRELSLYGIKEFINIKTVYIK